MRAAVIKDQLALTTISYRFRALASSEKMELKFYRAAGFRSEEMAASQLDQRMLHP